MLFHQMYRYTQLFIAHVKSYDIIIFKINLSSVIICN